jgi:dihydroxy-acid dehydratase
MAIGGSTNSMMHIPAVAAEAGLSMNCWDVYDNASHEIPLLMNVRPTGKFTMYDYDQAGGLRSVMYEIKDHLDLDLVGVNGKSVRENVEGHKTTNPEAIRTMDNPFTKDGGICILKGNIAPDGCAAKQSTFPRNMLRFRGPAKVFFTSMEAIEALRAGKIVAGDAVVIMMMGAKAGPGMMSAYAFTSELAGTRLWDKVCLVTDGRFSGAAKGAITGYCSPEAGLGGPICAVRDGDIISYDVEARTINVELTDEQIAERIKSFDKEVVMYDGFMGMYQRSVTSLRTGAVLRPAGFRI